jgi:hypothetical protein
MKRLTKGDQQPRKSLRQSHKEAEEALEKIRNMKNDKNN